MDGAAGASAAGSSAAMAAVINATKASGVIIHVKTPDFLEILQRMEYPLIVTAEGGFFSTTYRYLTTYGGMYFFTKSKTPLALPEKHELIRAQKIWVPEI